MKEHLQNLIQKYSDEKLTLKEQIELSELMADKNNPHVEQSLRESWQTFLVSEGVNNRNLQSILNQVHHRIRLNENDQVKRTSLLVVLQRIAAVLIIPLLLAFFVYIYMQSDQSVPETSYAEINCPLGVRAKFVLPDGSTGFLNSGARLKYPVVFTQQRTVELTGEAFFDIIPDKDLPFHVITRNLDIKVLGTTFNVIADENVNTEEIVLQSGIVDVSSKNGSKLAVLAPDDQFTLDVEKQVFRKRTVVASQYTSWKEGKLVFRNENMQRVAQRLSRWYNADIVVEDRLLDKYTFHATFIDEPLDEVLKLLAITTPISYTEEKRKSDTQGIYRKRRIFLHIDNEKIRKFNLAKDKKLPTQ